MIIMYIEPDDNETELNLNNFGILFLFFFLFYLGANLYGIYRFRINDKKFRTEISFITYNNRMNE